MEDSEVVLVLYYYERIGVSICICSETVRGLRDEMRMEWVVMIVE